MYAVVAKYWLHAIIIYAVVAKYYTQIACIVVPLMSHPPLFSGQSRPLRKLVCPAGHDTITTKGIVIM